MPELFAQVILPLSLHDSFTYKVPESLQSGIQPGVRVIVQFGKRKLYAALVYSISDAKPEDFEPKEIQQILDDEPIVLPQNFVLWQWIANYYCCTLGDVFRAALPTGLKLESKSKIFLTGAEVETKITAKEDFILRQLQQDITLLVELQKKLDTNFSYSALKSLLAKNLIFIEEKVSAKYKPKTESFVRFHADIKSEASFEKGIEKLGRAKKQLALLYHFCNKTKAFEPNQISTIHKKELFENTNFNSGLLKGLVEKNILVQFQKQVPRIEDEEINQISINLLNEYQAEALLQIKSVFETKQVALIHGITASGKTEIYIHLIDEIIKLGRQALYLVPEIALTTQIVKRLKNGFGRTVGIYHSK
ncbi:MAG: DEAD/DEAH box helicase family protein, partial [Draconibacterium sp.]|nr:DEAD/DEAH box helicase family protein [Draconibacterium sp.]